MDIAELELRVKSLEAEKAARRVTNELKKTERQAEKTSADMQKGFKGIGASLGNIRTMLAGVGAFVAMRQGIRTIGNFEQSMANARSVVQGITQEDFANLNKTARELGATTVFSASQAAEGIQFLGMAGFSTEKIIASLPGTLDLAAAGAVDLGTAADISSNILSAFSLEASEMGRVSDVMAMAIHSSNQNMYELAEAVNYAAPTLAPLGIELEDVAAGASVLANQGIKASMAGTTMRQMFIKLLDPSKESLKILGQHNLTLQDLNPRFNELSDIFTKLQALSPEELIQVFGARGIAGATAITNNLEDMVKFMKDYRESAEGTAKAVADIRLDTLQGDWKLLKSAVEEFTLSVGDEGASGALRKLVQLATKGVQTLNDNWDFMVDSLGVAMMHVEAAFWTMYGVYQLINDKMKKVWIGTLNWILKQGFMFFQELSAMVGNHPFFQGLRDQALDARDGVLKLQQTLRAVENMVVGDEGAAAFAKASELRQGAGAIVLDTAGQALAEGIRGYQENAAAEAKVLREKVEREQQQLEENTKSSWRRIGETAEAVINKMEAGWKQASASYGDMGQRLMAVGETINYSLDQNITDGLVSMIDGTKSVKEAFRDMANQIIADLIRVMIQQLIVRTALSAFGGGGGALGGVMHDGGVVGLSGGADVSRGSFRGASRFSEGGLAGDEVPIIAHQGEVVFNEEQMAALGNVMSSEPRQRSVEIVNVTDPRMVDERINANPEAILNVMSKHRSQFRRTLGIPA